MQTVKVPRRNKKHKILVYALSTCGWCKRAKQFLKDNDVDYEYIDVDLCNLEDKQKIFKEIKSRWDFSIPNINYRQQIIIDWCTSR